LAGAGAEAGASAASFTPAGASSSAVSSA
jgi:hypothetical protein